MKPITLNWQGGEHQFALPIGHLRALQSATDAGPEQILRRMSVGDWRVDDLIEILRQGLMGGGMANKDAGQLVLRIFDLHPLYELKPVAYAVLASALVGPEDDPVGEPEGATTPPESGSSANSTEPEQSSDSAPLK